MGLLDDLEAEASRRQSEADGVRRERADAQRSYRTETEPKLKEIHEYLDRLAQQLNILKPERKECYEIPGFGVLEFALLPDYQLRLEKEKWQCEMVLTTHAQLERGAGPQREVSGKPQIKALIATLQRLHLGSAAKGEKDEKGNLVHATIQPYGKLPVELTISSDVNSDRIKLECANYGELGATVRYYTVTQVDSRLLDNVARFVAREPNDLLVEELPEEYRNHLRTELKKNRLKRKWETRLTPKPQSEPTRTEAIMDKIADETESLAGKIRDTGLINSLLAKLKRRS